VSVQINCATVGKHSAQSNKKMSSTVLCHQMCSSYVKAPLSWGHNTLPIMTPLKLPVTSNAGVYQGRGLVAEVGQPLQVHSL
jgi:hypothetical protein